MREPAGELDARLDDQLVGAAFRAVLDELAVDLEVVERQILQVVEGTETGAEVVEREMTTEGGQLVDELARAVDVLDRGRLGDLEDEPVGIDGAAAITSPMCETSPGRPASDRTG